MSEEYDYDEEQEDGDPQWRALSPKERKELLKNVFSNKDWYEDGGLPVFEGGNANPLFEVIGNRVGAPAKEITRYYAAWLNSQGFNAEEYLRAPSSSSASTTSNTNLADFMIKEEPQPTSQSQSMGMGMISEPAPMPAPPGASGDAAGMWAMMNFLTSQQRMAMQQQQFQMMQMMEQRKLDQNREEGQRREAMARDQQFMNQQMAFMREMMKKSGDDGFFDSDMKKIMKEKVVDQMLGGGESDWKEMVKDVVGSDTLKAAAAGIGSAIGSRNNIPAGYDVPGYNPYAQPVAQNPQQQVQQLPPQAMQPQQAPPQQMDGVFFDDQLPAQQSQQMPQGEPSRDDYAKIILESWVASLGPAVNDPDTMKALKEQVEVAVDTTLIEGDGLLPNYKLGMMTDKMLLIRNLRDIGLGIKDLRERTPQGDVPGPMVMGVVVEELRKRPEFYNIFATNTYDELVAIIEPFKNAGEVRWDYEYLLDPDSATMCRYLISAIQSDAQQNGAPPIPGREVFEG